MRALWLMTLFSVVFVGAKLLQWGTQPWWSLLIDCVYPAAFIAYAWVLHYVQNELLEWVILSQGLMREVRAFLRDGGREILGADAAKWDRTFERLRKRARDLAKGGK